MKNPLYTFGDKVKVKMKTTVSGVEVECEIDKVVCAIKAQEISLSDGSLQMDTVFFYGLASDLMFQKHFIWSEESYIRKIVSKKVA